MDKGRSFVTIMVVIALSALILRIVIERLIKLNIAQNEAHASLTLKLISTALENYVKDNQGVYPASLSVLTKPIPPFLDKDYVALSPFRGYNYTCPRLEPSGYTCYASPTRCGLTGQTIYTISTGGLLGTERCQRKEEE